MSGLARMRQHRIRLQRKFQGRISMAYRSMRVLLRRSVLPLRLGSLLLILTTTCLSLPVAGNSSPPLCLMRPAHFKMHLPRAGFTWLDGGRVGDQCDDVPAQKWIRRDSGSLALFIYPSGPSGSGRYWNVTLGVGPREYAKPTRGVCLTTSTVGWRTLREYKATPLAWLDDLDEDGKSEFILWSSFPLRAEASLAEYGLMAWVYRVDASNTPVLDWILSRRMAREMAHAYRSSVDSGALQAEAAAELERFADQRCSLSSPDDR
jgi:hypothetical protein